MKKQSFILIAICIFHLGDLNLLAAKPQSPPSLPTLGRGYSTATDGSGYVYMCGFFQSSSITFGTTTLTNTSSGYYDIFILKYDPAGNVLWAKSVGGSNHDVARNIVTDNNGNFFVTGYFYSPTITFGTITLTNTGTGTGDMFIVKFDASGNVLWAKSAGGIYHDVGNNIVTDAAGNVYVSGTFQSSSITFGSFTFTNPAPGNPGTWDTYLVKYDASGNVVWAKSDWYGAEPCGLATDGNSNVYLVGDFNNSYITFGSITLTNSATGYYDMYVVKFDAGGNVQWATSAGGSGDDYGWGISEDISGNVYLTGHFSSSTITFGEITLTNSSGNADMYIVKYGPNGYAQWARSATGGINFGRNLATDGNGNVYVTGDFVNFPITFGTITLTNAGSSDVFIVKYDVSGNVLWAKRAGGSNGDVGYGISTDGGGNAYISGYFASSKITFGAITLSNTTGNKGDQDIFVAKYDGNGNVPWAKGAGLISVGSPKSDIAEPLDPTADEISVYPNPTRGRVTLSTGSQTAITGISIFSITGKEVISQQPASGISEVTIDLSAQVAGIYIAIIKAGENLYKRKIVVE